MEELFNNILDLIIAILDWLQMYFNTVLPEDTAIAIVESSKDLFVRFYALFWEYVNILGSL